MLLPIAQLSLFLCDSSVYQEEVAHILMISQVWREGHSSGYIYYSDVSGNDDEKEKGEEKERKVKKQLNDDQDEKVPSD